MVKDVVNCKLCNLSIENIEKKNMFFERKVTYSGRSLVMSIPEDLAKYMGLTKGNSLKIVPVNRKMFVVEKTSD
ncbi:MAG: hypothetical protein ACP5H8_00255 [Candidatus Micrarchaeia archaeon]